MTLSDDNITEIFCQVDTFCIHFFKALDPHIVGNPAKKKPKLCVSEVITLMILFHHSGYRQPLKDPAFIKAFTGKLYADKGYISAELTNALFCDGIHLVTQIRNNMKNCLMELKDKILLRKRSIIETINDELKNICQIEHSRHRSLANFLSNLLAGLAAYSFFPKKPAIKYEPVQTKQLV
ncbi:MAG: hypothetical protein EA391_15010 [Balneolaceae bacterium]|nr:MAG: hypothetical protein EA391_15010 [Balneolaceae bacterium]